MTDRLAEEPDGINRIAIFGFPGQVAMLKDRLEGFMEGVFKHSRFKVNANLRGFYFTSGTQEGTPIDSVLGAMARNFGNVDATGAMSGQGRSFAGIVSARVCPSISSIAMNSTTPPGVSARSIAWSVTMFGWFSAATDRASRSKLARRFESAGACASSFSAT